MRRLFAALLLAATLSGVSLLWSATAQAQQSPELTKEQENRISVNCVSMKSTVTQLHATDALLRVNRGQIYESMASNLMERFNSRLGSNSLDNKAMLTVTGSYRSALTKFRTDYISYEQKLSQALRIDCVSQPAAFYSVLQEARALRETVHEDVDRLHQLIDDYRTSVNGFFLNYERLSN